LKVCPYMEYSLQILGRKWNGLILHYLSLCENGTSHFSEFKRDLPNITPKALSLKLSELIEHALIVKKVVGGTPVSITYELTEKGRSLVASFQPLQTWAQPYVNPESQTK
jgi:DNA-binding HxlR family transcriptional regulator